MTDDTPVIRLRIMNYSDLDCPPLITNSMSAPVVGVAVIGNPNIGTPIPVPAVEINPERTIATHTEMILIPRPVIDASGIGENEEVTNSDVVAINDEPGSTISSQL